MEHPLHINFIDFKKAFDSVHRESLWRILRHYGIPPKIISLIGIFYDHFECSVILDNTLSEAFPVESGVRQGCILSPILFLTIIDWIMRNTTLDQPGGIQWTLFSHLEDIDYADDLAVLSTNYAHLQEKTTKLNNYAKQTGLYISETKTKVTEAVDDFIYLGSVISKDNGTQKDIKARLSKARGEFSRLQPIRGSQNNTA